MNTSEIRDVTSSTLAGTLSFPEVVGRLLAAGVESYLVDYVTKLTTYYGAADESFTTALVIPQLPSVAADFDGDALRAAIRDSQMHGQTFVDFSHRAAKAGVISYIAFLRGRRVTYWGRTGDQHVERFPGSEPVSK